jgi:glycosyltransferase involved in cell wall biosynthesis/FtsZ-binding cell division protein ZapB
MLNNSRPEDLRHNPKISVIIPLYNHEKYIREAIDSVIGQSFDDFELIIINDGSTDNSEAIVRDINDDRINYFYQENQGASQTINRGIKLARGEYVSILNSDDVYYRNRLEEALKIFESDNSIYAVFSHLELIDEEGNCIRIKKGAEENWLGLYPDTSFKEYQDIILDLLAGNFLHTTSNLICKRSVYDSIGYFTSLRYTHDYEFFLKLCNTFKVYILEEPLLKYRFHSSNTLNTDYATSNFETGIVLATFILNNELPMMFENNDQKYQIMTRFFNSINTYDTDKIIMTLVLFGLKYQMKDELFRVLTEEADNPFRKNCIESLRKVYDMSSIKRALAWQEGQTELWWRKAEECRSETESLKSETESLKSETESLKSEAESLGEEIRQRDDRISHLLGKESMLNNILISNKWKFILKIEKIIGKILPDGSRRRLWVQDFLRKTF